VPIILDGKFGDIGHSAAKYAKFAFEELGVDAVTVDPWGGRADGLDAFLEYKDKGIFVWCRGSNKGAEEFQDRLYLDVALRVGKLWNTAGNCGLVMGATHPTKFVEVRRVVGDMPMLIPGIDAQKGDLEKSIEAAICTDLTTGERSLPAIINSSRGIIYASKGEDFTEAARKKTEEFNDKILNVLNVGG
jgi:orotidine-5'-phosphate decarboxylase